VIIPSIDLMNGDAVQLIGGREKALNAGDPRPVARAFGVAGDIAVIDLDAALGQGSNKDVIKELLTIARCRVGGGIRDVEAAVEWLDAGAEKIILGTAARPEILKELPKERVLAALDAYKGEVVVEGWQRATGETIFQRMEELGPYVGGYLVTFVESEGRLKGIDLDKVAEVVEKAGSRRVTVAGGVTSAEEVAAIDRLGADCQVGMALYTQRLGLAEAIAAPLRTDRDDGLWPTVICDESGKALGLAYSKMASLRQAVETRRGVYWSRSRGELWVKGQSSGASQDLLKVDLDCDRDTLRFTVRQKKPGFCHFKTRHCWGQDSGLSHLYRRLETRKETAPEGSYSKRLFADSGLLKAKLLEEAGELVEATETGEVIHEAADLLFFTLTKMVGAGVSLEDVERELDRRSLKMTRRPGNAKSSGSETHERERS
jgi:phosphoribosyl-AMP cyclohydrolase / phosphoribosyl-ATP pyrophosphohydrolase